MFGFNFFLRKEVSLFVIFSGGEVPDPEVWGFTVYFSSNLSLFLSSFALLLR